MFPLGVMEISCLPQSTDLHEMLLLGEEDPEEQHRGSAAEEGIGGNHQLNLDPT